MELTVVERPKQASSREAGPNPFTDAVKELVAQDNPKAAVSFTLEGVKQPVKGKTETGKDKVTLDKAVNKALNQLRQAGEAQTPQVSVRTKVEYKGTKTSSTATVTFWPTAKITRKRKGEAETPSAS